MKFLRLILTFSLVLNLGTQAVIACDMKACKISKKIAPCCKKEVVQQSECCCTKMKCKVTEKYNDVLLPITHRTIVIQYEYLVIQDVFTITNQAIIHHFLPTYFHLANPPSKNNIPLLV